MKNMYTVEDMVARDAVLKERLLTMIIKTYPGFLHLSEAEQALIKDAWKKEIDKVFE